MQLATHKNAIGVAVGASLGHTVCTSLAVIGGSMLASKISQRTVATIGGVLFLGFSVSSYFYPPLWWKGTVSFSTFHFLKTNLFHLDRSLEFVEPCWTKQCNYPAPAGCCLKWHEVTRNYFSIRQSHRFRFMYSPYRTTMRSAMLTSVCT
jgi:hypothetical protein